MVVVREDQLKQRTRIGIFLEPSGRLSEAALTFLLLHLNKLQSSFEYEVLPLPYQFNDCELGKSLASSKPAAVNRLTRWLFPSSCVRRWPQLKREMSDFLSSYPLWWDWPIKEPLPDHFILVSTVRLEEGYYFRQCGNFCLLALGDWKLAMAPPSVVEFTVTLVLRASVSIACPEVLEKVHLGTKGCLFDFNPVLTDVRYKVLCGFICSHCSRIMDDIGCSRMREDVEAVLRRKDWIGAPGDPASPSAIASKLGHDLFLTKGLKPTFWETVRQNLVLQGTREFLGITGYVILAALLLWLGLK